MLLSAKRREYKLKRACSLICAHKYQAVLREAFWKFLLLVMDISHESDTQLVEFNVEYTYYGTSRKTPIFIGKTQLNSMRYDQLSPPIISEIPYLGRINVPIRYCIKDGKENEIDISPKYFTHQITRLLGSGLNAFSVRVIESESPLSSSSSTTTYKGNAARDNTEHENPTTGASINAGIHRHRVLSRPNEPAPAVLPRKSLLTPLERYSQKHNEHLNMMNDQIELSRQELTTFDDKLNQACRENSVPLTACGKCHLKLGHTRRNCSFSPCKAGFPLANIFARSEFFFCLYPISSTWFQLRDQRQIKNSLRAKKFASGKPAKI